MSKAGKEELDELLTQKNKQHKGLREKIKKKRKRTKEVKKEKKEKKKVKDAEKEANKDKKHKKRKDKKNHHLLESKLFKIIKKFLGVFEDEINEFFGIFDSLDAGEKIAIEDLEDPKIKKYLKKMFKYMKLDYNSTTHEFIKNHEVSKGAKLGDKVREYVEMIQRREELPEPDKRERDSDAIEEPQLYKKLKLDQLAKQLPPPVAAPKVPEPPVEEPPAKKVYGPAIMPQLVGADQPKFTETEVKSRGEDYLDNLFGSLDKEHAHLKKHYDKEKYAGDKKKTEYTPEEQEQMREFLDEYNAANRPKTLMEVHKEMQQQKKSAKGGIGARREFSRDKDLSAGRVDSKHLYRVVNDTQLSLGSRFQDGKFEKTF